MINNYKAPPFSNFKSLKFFRLADRFESGDLGELDCTNAITRSQTIAKYGE
jgi:hypothetical protein